MCCTEHCTALMDCLEDACSPGQHRTYWTSMPRFHGQTTCSVASKFSREQRTWYVFNGALI